MACSLEDRLWAARAARFPTPRAKALLEEAQSRGTRVTNEVTRALCVIALERGDGDSALCEGRRWLRCEEGEPHRHRGCPEWRRWLADPRKVELFDRIKALDDQQTSAGRSAD